MRQYTPLGNDLPNELTRQINDYEYSLAKAEFEELGLAGFVQDKSSVGSDKIPEFNIYK